MHPDFQLDEYLPSKKKILLEYRPQLCPVPGCTSLTVFQSRSLLIGHKHWAYQIDAATLFEMNTNPQFRDVLPKIFHSQINYIP